MKTGGWGQCGELDGVCERLDFLWPKDKLTTLQKKKRSTKARVSLAFQTNQEVI